ncbi:hypothetical protein AGMMS49579_02570 [Spirochaetia bacterium]|nr:hypothetical protein AGMMS49579_02570 [Spirochaetia bacterium]
MKKTFGIILMIFSLGLAGCASVARDAHYADLAKEHDFDYFFPSSNFSRSFPTTDEAYDFVKIATAKFSNSVNKSVAKGLAAKLDGPAVTTDNPVTVLCIMSAATPGGGVDLSKIEKPLEAVLRESTSVTLIFLVFYNDRAVSISKFYLEDNYVYSDGNSQVEKFYVNKNTYAAIYPVGWGIEKAFQYLKGEVN